MEIVLVLAVILGIAFFITKKWRAEKAKLKGTGTDDLAKPLAVAPKPASKRLDTASPQAKPPIAEAAEKTKPAEVQVPAQNTPAPVSALFSNKQQEQIPEDSTLRRHYLSAKQAEKEAISHPYPTDSVLRRHYESMQALSLKPTALKPAAAVVIAENPSQPRNNQSANKQSLPEDSTLRRHALSQVRAEIESQLYARPTDSTLRRHYDSQVEAKMEEYLAQFVA